MTYAIAKPGVPGARDYIGNTDGLAKAKRAGTEEWVRQICHQSKGALWNNGTWQPGGRDMRGKPGTMSVHSTARAMDLSYRKMQNKGIEKARPIVVDLMTRLVAEANTLGIQAILDYWPAEHGRGWRCDRQAWEKYSKPTIHGAPGGDWIHIEISPQAADSVIWVKSAFLKVFGDILD
jgi:hypothetical protein